MEQEQIRMEFMKEYDQREEDRISLLQYRNLRGHFQDLIDTVLGDYYYNMGMCVYSCDKLTVEDLISKFYKLETHNKFLKIAAVSSLIANIVLIMFVMILY